MPKVKKMKTARAKSGVSLTEMTVVVAAVALLASLSTPTIRTFFDSLASRDDTRAMISASLSAARAIAAKEQRYAGIRFQKAYHPQGPLYGQQYMIFIVHDPEATTLANGFRTVEGIKPKKLPEGIGVMDLRHRTNLSSASDPQDDFTDLDIEIDEPYELTDTTAFSIIFSPSGKMVIHYVRVWNRDGAPRWPLLLDNSNDDVFNTIARITDILNPAGMFVQDDYAGDGLGQELSRSSFVIYDRAEFGGVNVNSRWTDYLARLVSEMIYINAYTGRIISSDQ